MMLPDGSSTVNEDEYFEAWESFVKPIADATGTQLAGFDPTVSLSNGERLIQLPRWFIKAFNENHE